MQNAEFRVCDAIMFGCGLCPPAILRSALCTLHSNYNLSLTFPNVSFSSDSEESRLEMLYVLPF